MVLEINEDEFDEKMQGKCVVDFFTPWCGPCKMLAPVLDELSEEMEGVSFFKVNVDENVEIGSDFDILNIPTLIVFQDGEIVSRTTGFMNKEKLKTFING
ncbi:MAG: thioredoxin [Oscillospiraceae bacterium]|nr:thioredoxin [Oscillospiraceae bacterium]